MIFDTSWLLWIFALFVGDVGSVSYPEAQLDGNSLGWNPGEIPRIDHPELCRPMPPGERSVANANGILYIVGYLWSVGGGGLSDYSTRCKYFAYDANHDDEYEMEVEGLDINTCSEGEYTAGTYQSCLMSVVNQEYIMIYCVINAAIVDGYLMKVTKKDDKYRLVKEDYHRWKGYLPIWNKHFYALVAYQKDQNNIFLIGNAPPWLIHIKIENNHGEINAWVGGDNFEDYVAGDARDYLRPTHLEYLFDCSYVVTDGNFCELTFDSNNKPVVTSISGAFNQIDCLRVRRGQVHYDASTQTATPAKFDDPYGYIIEVFDLKTRAIMNQKCFYSPTFTDKERHPGNVLPLWVGTDDIKTTLCQQGMDIIAPPQIEPEPRASNTTVCQTALFPPSAKGNFRIIGMEPDNSPAAGQRGLPRIAVYDGVQSTPLYIGDPAGVLKENCFVEENLSPTAFAHFGIRFINKDYFVAFCNRGYGSNEDFNEERRKKGSTVFVFKFVATPGDENDIVTLISKEYLQVAIPNTFNHFLDNRGVVMIPSVNEKTLRFVQMKPCAYFAVNLDDWKITVKPPNAVMDYVCQKQDLSLGSAVVDFNALSQCVLKTCIVNGTELIVGDTYEARSYITSDITRSKTTFTLGQFGCLESKYRLINESGQLHNVYTFNTPDSPNNTLEPCFMPFEQSGGFQIMFLGNDTETVKFCENPWDFGGEQPAVQELTTPAPVVSMPYISAPPTSSASNNGNATCPDLFVDTLTGVGLAAAFCLVCFSIFVAVVVASLIGRRNYNAHKAVDASMYTNATTIASTMTQISQMPAPKPTPVETPTPQEPSSYNLFSKVGEFEKGPPTPTPPPSETPVAANLFSKVGDFSKMK